MTKMTDIQSCAKKKLSPFMKENGFKNVNTFGYLKEGPEEIWFLIHAELSYGANLKVVAVCHTSEMQDLIGEDFPKYYSGMVAGALKPGTDIQYENRYIWDVSLEENIGSVLDEIQACIKDHVLPFFNSIANRKALVEFIYPSMLRDEYKRVADLILKWKCN